MGKIWDMVWNETQNGKYLWNLEFLKHFIGLEKWVNDILPFFERHIVSFKYEDILDEWNAYKCIGSHVEISVIRGEKFWFFHMCVKNKSKCGYSVRKSLSATDLCIKEAKWAKIDSKLESCTVNFSSSRRSFGNVGSTVLSNRFCSLFPNE